MIMDPELGTSIAELFEHAFPVAAVFVVGIMLVIYLPALLLMLLSKIGLFIVYRPPGYFYAQYLKKQAAARAAATASGPMNYLRIPPRPIVIPPPTTAAEDETKNYFGYYDQDYFRKYPKNSCKIYLRNNFILLITIFLQIAILMCMAVLLLANLHMDFTSLMTSALFPTIFALFHFSDLLRGYFAYVWFIWSDKLRLGDEIDIDNHRGDLVELGPVVSYVYVYMRGVPLIGSVEGPPPSETANQFSATNHPDLAPSSQDDNPSPMKGRVLSPLQQVALSNLNGQSATIINIVDMNNPASGVRQLPGVTTSKPFSLKNFPSMRPKATTSAEVAGQSHTLNSSRLQMHQIGYVALPIDQHFYYHINTSVLLQNNFRNYSYQSVHPHDMDGDPHPHQQ